MNPNWEKQKRQEKTVAVNRLAQEYLYVVKEEEWR
jgi:hypothetical protein